MDQRGSAVIEFAIVVPLVLALALGVVEVALVARDQLMVMNAARAGAREAAANPDPASAVGAVRAALGGAPARVAVSRPHVVGETARVRVTVGHVVAAPLFGGFEVALTASASMRVER